MAFLEEEMSLNENPITKRAKEILANFEDKLDQPASLGLLHHKGLSMRDHIELCASIMQHLCSAYGVVGEDRDMLIACCYLHDIGKFRISQKRASNDRLPNIRGVRYSTKRRN